jgi:hypothetical protein
VSTETRLSDLSLEQRREALAEGRTRDNCKTLARFVRYQERNPDLLPILEQLVEAELERRDVFSVYPIIDDVVRWRSHELRLIDPEARFRIPNDFKPWYLRTILLRHPEWEDRLVRRRLFCHCGEAAA